MPFVTPTAPCAWPPRAPGKKWPATSARATNSTCKASLIVKTLNLIDGRIRRRLDFAAENFPAMSAMPDSVQILHHPLAAGFLTEIRDHRTARATVRNHIRALSVMLFYEATR